MSRDDDKVWAELVDAFHSSPDSDGDQPRWPAAENLDPDDEHDDDYGDASVTLSTVSAGSPTTERPSEPSADDEGDASGDVVDHFVPPAPAPIPRGDRVSRLAWAGVISGPAGLITMTIFSWQPSDELLFIAVMAFIAGFATLVARLRGHHPNDPDNGAVL